MLAKPTPVQYEWHETARSMFIHFGPATWQGREYDDGSTPLEDINPIGLDTDQWCQAALAFGAKRIVFVAKHTGGFCWWQTKTTDYSVGNTPWRGGRGDVMADLSASCKKFGISLGVYIYPGDRNWEAYIGGGGKTLNPANQKAYNKVFRTQLTEVLTCYGDICEVWFDGSCVIDVADILEQYAPNAVIFQGPQADIRWCGTERGLLPSPAWSSIWKKDLETGTATVMQSDPDGDTWAPLEVDTTLYDHFWFWSPQNAKHRKTPEQLLQTYYQSVGRGGVLLLNTSPNTEGLIPQEDIELLEEFGTELDRRFKKPLATAENKAALLPVNLPADTKIDHVVIMEDYRHGERIRQYRVEALSGGVWKSIAQGQHIGRKQIHAFLPEFADAVRVVIEKSADAPLIKSLAVYCCGGVGHEGLVKALSAETLAYDPATDSWVVPGKGVPVFSWQAEDAAAGAVFFEADLSGIVTEPGQYELLFAAEGGGTLEISEITGMLEGVPTEGIISCIQKGARYCLTRTSAVAESGAGKTAVRGELRCTQTPQRGSIMAQRVL